MKKLYIVAQSYDGSSVMSGCLGGIQAKIKDLYPCALYTHFMVHRLNLVVDMCKGIKVIFILLHLLHLILSHNSIYL